jgi:Holliday junction resolvase RusA-like endonuclease
MTGPAQPPGGLADADLMASDLAIVRRMLAAFTLDETVPPAAVMIRGRPHAKARPRFRHDGATYPPDQAAETTTAWHLRRVVRAPLAGNIALACLFFMPDAHRVDSDNLLKHLCDAGNGVAWADDCQVTATATDVQLDRQYPRTTLLIGAHVSTLTRGPGRPARKGHDDRVF